MAGNDDPSDPAVPRAAQADQNLLVNGGHIVAIAYQFLIQLLAGREPESAEFRGLFARIS
jgi:hypothetical protein